MGDLVDRVESIYAALSLACVSDERRGIATSPHLDKGETHVNGELGTLAMSTGELQPRTHLP
jgi:hypothetical protein